MGGACIRMIHRVTIERKAPRRAGLIEADANVLTWNSLGTRWAHVRPIKSQEIEVSAQLQAHVGYSIATRPTEGFTISAMDRLIWHHKGKNHTIIITSLLENEQGFLEILGYEVLA